MSQVYERFVVEIDAEVLRSLRALAQSEARPLESLVGEAFVDLIEKRKRGGVRSHVMGAYLASHGEHRELYRKLAE